jgi:hypothetical protein
MIFFHNVNKITRAVGFSCKAGDFVRLGRNIKNLIPLLAGWNHDISQAIKLASYAPLQSAALS